MASPPPTHRSTPHINSRLSRASLVAQNTWHAHALCLRASNLPDIAQPPPGSLSVQDSLAHAPSSQRARCHLRYQRNTNDDPNLTEDDRRATVPCQCLTSMSNKGNQFSRHLTPSTPTTILNWYQASYCNAEEHTRDVSPACHHAHTLVTHEFVPIPSSRKYHISTQPYTSCLARLAAT